MSGYVVALIGLPGAGKSTVARSLKQHFDLHEVNRDEIRAAMFPRCEFSRAEKSAAEDAVMAAVAANCEAGRDSIVDGMTFANGEALERLREVCSRAGYRVVSIWLDCPVAVACRRVRDNAHIAADRDANLVAEVAERFRPPSSDAIRLDATEPISSVCAASAEALRAATAGATTE